MKKQELLDMFLIISKWSNWLGVAGYEFKRQDTWHGKPAVYFKKKGADHQLILCTTTKGELSLRVIDANKRSNPVFNANPDFVREWKTLDELEPAVERALNEFLNN